MKKSTKKSMPKKATKKTKKKTLTERQKKLIYLKMLIILNGFYL